MFQPAEKRPKLFAEAETLIRSIPAEILDENRRKLKSGFKLFKLANESKLTKEISSLEERDKKMSRLWNQVSSFEPFL